MRHSSIDSALEVLRVVYVMKDMGCVKVFLLNWHVSYVHSGMRIQNFILSFFECLINCGQAFFMINGTQGFNEFAVRWHDGVMVFQVLEQEGKGF